MSSTNGHGPQRAILYARVSTDEQACSGYSLAQQIEALRAFAAREGYEVFEGVVSTGVRKTIENITIKRVVEGKIVEERNVAESTELWQQRMEQELQVARRIQLASLPKDMPELEGWQISHLYQPAR
jgi:serine phosphatase RsbU (regulator of sigma subunit)